jgi:hypothetical protein
LLVDGGRSSAKFAANCEAVGFVADLDDVETMGQTVQQRGGRLGIAEDAAPLRERQVGGDDETDLLIELADQVKQQRPAIGAEGQIAEFVEHDDTGVGEPVR